MIRANRPRSDDFAVIVFVPCVLNCSFLLDLGMKLSFQFFLYRSNFEGPRRGTEVTTICSTDAVLLLSTSHFASFTVAKNYTLSFKRWSFFQNVTGMLRCLGKCRVEFSSPRDWVLYITVAPHYSKAVLPLLTIYLQNFPQVDFWPLGWCDGRYATPWLSVGLSFHHSEIYLSHYSSTRKIRIRPFLELYIYIFLTDEYAHHIPNP